MREGRESGELVEKHASKQASKNVLEIGILSRALEKHGIGATKGQGRKIKVRNWLKMVMSFVVRIRYTEKQILAARCGFGKD